MSIFLIRHGETLGNASRTVQLPDNPLSARGALQAARLARRLEHERIVLILSSDYSRAVATADHLRRVTRAPVRYSPLLQERNFGDLRGTPYAELGFDMFEAGYAPPNGETWEAFHDRVDRAWAFVQAAAATAAGHVAVVTHGLVCRSLADRHLVLAEGEPPPAAWQNTSLTIIDHPPPWRVRLLNCAAHLDDVETRPRPESGAV